MSTNYSDSDSVVSPPVTLLTLSLSTCAVSALVHAVMYKRLQRCRAEVRSGELCSTPQLSHLSCEAELLPPYMQG